MSVQLPVFPLNTVAFPCTPVVLHIFEERYRTMVHDMEQSEMRFCVALIREGQEVGSSAIPHSVATIVEVVHLRPMADGQYNLVAIGSKRVKITALDYRAKPYIVGTVETWPEQGEKVEQALLNKTTRLFSEYVRVLMELSGDTPDEITLPVEGDKLSYIVASELQIQMQDRQCLLEVPATTDRLKAEVILMQAELPLLRALRSSPAPRRNTFSPFSRN